MGEGGKQRAWRSHKKTATQNHRTHAYTCASTHTRVCMSVCGAPHLCLPDTALRQKAVSSSGPTFSPHRRQWQVLLSTASLPNPGTETGNKAAGAAPKRLHTQLGQQGEPQDSSVGTGPTMSTSCLAHGKQLPSSVVQCPSLDIGVAHCWAAHPCPEPWVSRTQRVGGGGQSPGHPASVQALNRELTGRQPHLSQALQVSTTEPAQAHRH